MSVAKVKGPHSTLTSVVEVDGRRVKVFVLEHVVRCSHGGCRSEIPAGDYVYPSRNRPDVYCSAVCRARHQAVLKARARQADPATRESDNHVRRMTKYGISTEDYERLYDLQLGRCGICLSPLTETKKIHVDHDHETQRVRGLLCNLCNPGLGFFQDDIHILERAVAYLRSSKFSDTASASSVVVGEGV